MRITATKAKNRFGGGCAQAEREPVSVEKAGQVDTDILSVGHCHALRAPQDVAGVAARKQAFEADFGEVKVLTTLDRDLQRVAVRSLGRAALWRPLVAGCSRALRDRTSLIRA